MVVEKTRVQLSFHEFVLFLTCLLCRLQSAMLDLASLEPEVAGVCAAGAALASEATEAAHAATMRTAVQLLKDKLDDVKTTSQHKQVLLQVRALMV